MSVRDSEATRRARALPAGPSGPETPLRDDGVTTPAEASGPETTSRDDGVTMLCPVCGRHFVVSGRRRYCGDACRVAAWRRRHQGVEAPVVIPPPRPRRALTVYECGSCGGRAVGSQYCEECRIFMSRVGLGGHCPECDAAVSITDLFDKDVLETT
jgi:hypothetical protein